MNIEQHSLFNTFEPSRKSAKDKGGRQSQWPRQWPPRAGYRGVKFLQDIDLLCDLVWCSRYIVILLWYLILGILLVPWWSNLLPEGRQGESRDKMGLQSEVSRRSKLSTFNVESSFSSPKSFINEILSINYLVGSVEVVWVEQRAKALDCGRFKVDNCATPVNKQNIWEHRTWSHTLLTMVDTSKNIAF